MVEDPRAEGPGDVVLLGALQDAFMAESGPVTVDSAFVEQATRRCQRARMRAAAIRLAAPLLVAAALGFGAITGGAPGGSGSAQQAAPNQVASSVQLTGPAIRLSGFTVPTPVHYTPTTRACGLRTMKVYAVSGDGSACLQVSLASRSGLHVPQHATWVIVGRNRAVLEHHDAGTYTRLMVIVPARTTYRLFVVSASSLSDHDLLALAKRIVPPAGR